MAKPIRIRFGYDKRAKTAISSGVASYETDDGGDENPFHVPAKVYTEKKWEHWRLPTILYTEEPFAETFFPGPSVGYSKVTVQTFIRTGNRPWIRCDWNSILQKIFPRWLNTQPIDDDTKKSLKRR